MLPAFAPPHFAELWPTLRFEFSRANNSLPTQLSAAESIAPQQRVRFFIEYILNIASYDLASRFYAKENSALLSGMSVIPCVPCTARFGYCECVCRGVSVDKPNPERTEMFGKLSIWISSFVLAAVLAVAPSAQATVRKTNVLTGVRTQIVPNFNHTETDVCFIYNANN